MRPILSQNNFLYTNGVLRLTILIDQGRQNKIFRHTGSRLICIRVLQTLHFHGVFTRDFTFFVTEALIYGPSS